MRHLWRSASWGILARSRLCGQGSIVHRREPRDGSTPSKDVRLQHCGCHDKVHRAAACKIRRSVKCSRLCTRRNLPWTAWRLSKDLAGLRYQGIVNGAGRSGEPPARDGCTTSIAGRLLYPPASMRELHDLVALPARSSADGDRHQRGFEIAAGSGRRPFQAALFKPPWPWPWPRGSRSHPSRPATGNHRARARVPSAEP